MFGKFWSPSHISFLGQVEKVIGPIFLGENYYTESNIEKNPLTKDQKNIIRRIKSDKLLQYIEISKNILHFAHEYYFQVIDIKTLSFHVNLFTYKILFHINLLTNKILFHVNLLTYKILFHVNCYLKATCNILFQQRYLMISKSNNYYSILF